MIYDADKRLVIKIEIKDHHGNVKKKSVKIKVSSKNKHANSVKLQQVR